MKALKLAILITVFIPAIGKAKDDDVRVKAHFLNAKQRLENMLTGKEAMSFEEAIYQIENAWYEGRIDRSSFDEVITHHIANIRELVNGNADEEGLNPVTDLKGTKEQKLKNHRTSLTNYAIYNYMTTSSLWVDETNFFLHKPYQYSRQDPMGTWDWTNTQVTHLLNESNGNCFALAALFRIFSERLNSDAKLCTAPGHIYIRHANEKGTYYNVELSSRSFPGTGTIETLTYTPNEATKNNVSLRELDLKQSVALCLVYLAKGYEHKLGIKDDDFMLACAETALQFDERNLNAMLLKAEVLEYRLLAHNRDIRLLKKHLAFEEYQQWLTHIFSLGYREMPFEMKNILLKGWTRDTILQLAATDHTPKRTDHSNLTPARYASLSWGLFDEEIKTKPLERYGNTVFDTRKKEIVAFLQEHILYNQYNFDPVVFAWNVDPLAHEFPWQSPYAAFDNSPIWKNDPTGKSGEVVIDKQSKVMTVNAKIVLYGGAATAEMANKAALQTMNAWNAANGKVQYGGEEYSVRFNISGEYRDVRKNMDFLPGVPKVAGEILTNTDIRNNYYRVELTNKASETSTPSEGSFFFGANSGYINFDQNKRTGGTTIPHEFGHSMGAGHPAYDGINKRMMNTESQLGGDVKDRQVTQQDIDDLGLQDLNFSNGKANLGQTTNMYYDAGLDKGYQMTTK